VFLEQYKLEANPFVADATRPVLASHSTRYCMLKLEELLSQQIQTLFLSGPAGVGKTALASQRLRQPRDLSVSWIEPTCETREALYEQLFSDVGPGLVEGSTGELRHILEVYLRHQASKDHPALFVLDGIERFSAPVLREFEALAQMRLRNRPIAYLLAITRSEELVADLLPTYNGGTFARAVHQRLAGFTLDETRAYVRGCIRGAGCEWAEELVPDEVILDIQAFTQGVVGDINALCCAALDAIATRATGSNRQPRVTRALLKEAGLALNLRFDATAWEPPIEDVLSPGAVHLRNPSDLHIEAASLIVTSGKTLVAEISLSRPRMVLGRDDSCDISVDSHYVSRFQNLFMQTPEGWILVDLSSTNGCFVNGRRVREHYLRDGDLIAVGQHQMRFAGPSTRRLQRPEEGGTAYSADDPDATLSGPNPFAARSTSG